MRTKTLLIAVAALATGVLASKADNVYSANVVGYVNLPLSSGYSLICNPLSNTTNNAEVLFPAIQPFDSLLFWNGSGYTAINYNGPGDWSDSGGNPVAAPTILPGAAVFYQNNSGDAETNTFVGTVVLTNSVTLAAGYSFIGSAIPVGGAVDGTNITLPFQPFDSILFWNGSGYTAYNYNDVNDWSDSGGNPVSAPTVKVGQGFFYQNNSGSPEQWTQSLTP